MLPSKLFEYAASGKPIWAGVAGYANEFVSEKIDNCAVFKPCDANDAKLAFEKLKIITQPRTQFNEEFSGIKIMNKMANSIIQLGQNG